MSKPCPVGGCSRRHRPEVLMCRPHWSMVRGGDGGALARQVYEAASAYYEAPSAETLAELRELQAAAVAKAERRADELAARQLR